MMDDQTQFLALMSTCLVVGLFLSLTDNKREREVRKYTEEEMRPYLLPKDNDQNKTNRK